MTRRTGVAAICVMMLVSAVAWAGVCPLCLKQIPEGQKYCSRHQKELLAARATAQEEQTHVDAVVATRAEYRSSLEELKKFYEGRGDAEGLRNVDKELEHLLQGQRFYRNWEDTLPQLSATQEDPEADKLLAKADELRKGINPFTRAKRFREAAVKYQKILMDHPNSMAVDDAAYGLGEIYAHGAVSEYRRAVHFYELSYLSNPDTPYDGLFRAAQVCDGELADYENAARYYWMAYKATDSGLTRKRAGFRLEQLQGAGFGKDYVLEKVGQKETTDTSERK